MAKVLGKKDLVEKIAKETGVTKTAAKKALDVTLDSVKAALAKGDTVRLIGFGTFQTAKRKARKGINPQTGEAIKIPAGKRPAFKAGKALKDAVAKKK